ncbi:MAG TPA: type III-B CRISPR module-associated protein Cmr5 [Thermoanaerobaculia bacterium]|jgi:CRISPR/Cas system CMR-associated protein Cmr5 small subunit
MPKPTVEQQRAKFALEKIRGKAGSPEKKDYLIQLRRLPAQLHWGGLGQTVASLRADAENKVRQDVCGWLEAWLRERNIYPGAAPLIDCITGTGNAVPPGQVQKLYVVATHETRALAVWLKKFAEAFLDDVTETNDEATASSAAG